MLTQINFLAVLVSAVVAFLLAFFWYVPPVFGLRWADLTKQYTGLSDTDLGSHIPVKAGFWFIGFFVNAFALGVLINLTQTSDLRGALTLGIVSCLGIGAVVSSWPPIHARQPWGIWLMNNGLFLLQQIAMGTILTLWR